MKKKMVPVRMDEELLARLDERKKELNASGRSELIREAIRLFVRSGQPELNRQMVSEFKAWRTVFRGVGTNLNQLAIHMNSNYPLPVTQALEVLNRLNTAFKGMADNLKRMRNDLEI